MLKPLIVLAVSLLVGTSAGADRFYRGKADGWFWYQDPPPATEAPLPAAPPATPPTAPPAPVNPPPVAAPATAAPPPLSPAWLRANLDRYRDAAIAEPTEANVAAYLYLQRYSLDLADRFAEVWQRVVARDPWLDENQRRPLAGFAAAHQSEQASAGQETLLQSLAQAAGLWFFYRSDCPYCHSQAQVLTILVQRYGFPVLPIALDGQPLPDGSYPHFTADHGQAASLGVTTVPALFLVRPPDGLVAVSQGVLAADQLAERLLSVAVEAGWLNAEDYRQSRPVQRDRRLPAVAPTGLDEASLADPERLVEFLRQTAASQQH